MLHRKFISVILSAAIAVTSVSATTAQAETRYVYPQQNRNQGNEAVAAALAGIAALFIIGKTIERNNDRRDKAAPAPRSTHKHKGHHNNHGHGHKAHRGHGNGHGGGHKRHAHGGHGGHGGHAHWHRHGNMKHIHGHGRKHHRGRH